MTDDDKLDSDVKELYEQLQRRQLGDEAEVLARLWKSHGKRGTILAALDQIIKETESRSRELTLRAAIAEADCLTASEAILKAADAIRHRDSRITELERQLERGECK